MTQPSKILPSLIVLMYCALAIGYAILTPPWESPDETAHYLYAAHLAQRWRPEAATGIEQTQSFSKDQNYISSSYEWFQPALGYLPAALAYKIIHHFAPQSLPDEMPKLSALAPEVHRRYNIFLHPEKNLAETWSAAWGLLVMRIVSSLTGLVIILAAYATGNLLDEQSGLLGITAAGLIAFLPQFTYINASVRGDTLTSAIAALVFLLAAKIQLPGGLSNRQAGWMGLLLGLGLLSKNTFVYMLPIGLMAILLPNLKNPRQWFKPALTMIIAALVVFGAYYLAFDEARTALNYTANAMLKIKPEYLQWDYLKTIPAPLLIDLFYARFGWANIAVAAIWTNSAFFLWSVGAGLSLNQFIVHAKKTLTKPQVQIFFLLLAGIFFGLLGALRFNLSVYQPQGRFLFPVLLPWALLGLWGIWQILSPANKKHAALLLTGGMLLFNVYALFSVLFPAFWR
ncbi:MAG: hypothetical protein OHK0031_05240 [Anaerolineales bacterium]